MKLAVLCDVGSTFTKGRLVDLGSGELVAAEQVPTTVARGVQDGLLAVEKLLLNTVPSLGHAAPLRLASSSAAGGLKMVTVGLVPELTGTAARLAALGAGARVTAVYAFKLSQADLDDIDSRQPDILLLAGGADGGDEDTVLANTQRLTEGDWRGSVVYAGNKNAADRVQRMLTDAGFAVQLTDNVMPRLGTIHIDPAREVIRQVFMRHIVEARGWELVGAWADQIIMPTPLAVQHGIKLAAEVLQADTVLAFDVGGATTDVYSVGGDQPHDGVYQQGLPTPRLMRTVEGDLGLRVSLTALLEAAPAAALSAHQLDESSTSALMRDLTREPGMLVTHPLDNRLAAVCVELAAVRHAGIVEIMYTPNGRVAIQRGKDLSGTRVIIGTGGVLSRTPDYGSVLQAAMASPRYPTSLLPHQGELLQDRDYSLFAAGLLASQYPEAAKTLIRHTLDISSKL